MVTTIISILFIIMNFLMIIYWILFFRDNNKITYAIKLLTTFIFISVAIIASIYDGLSKVSNILLLIGIIMCGAGDLVLGLRRIFVNKKDLYMMLGIGVFFLSHVFYSVSFAMSFTSNYLYMILVVIALFVGFYFLVRYTNVKFGKFKIPCIIYTISASVMFSSTLLNMILSFSYKSVASFVGILLFIISDVFLCYTYFKKGLRDLKGIKLASILTYYIGQFVIGLSIML